MAGDTVGGPYEPYEDEGSAAEPYHIASGWLYVDGGDEDCNSGRDAVDCGLGAEACIDPGEAAPDMS